MVTFKYQVRVLSAGETEVRRLPANSYDDGILLSFPDAKSLIDELTSYGIEAMDIVEVIDAVEEADSFEWVMV